MSIFKIVMIFLGILAVSCGQSPSFQNTVSKLDHPGDSDLNNNSEDGHENQGGDAGNKSGGSEQQLIPDEEIKNHSNADSGVDYPAEKRRVETYSLGGENLADVVDFLFVMDNSCSIKNIIDRTTTGFNSLITQKVFPAYTNLAVMNSMPANFNDFSKVHSTVIPYANIEKEPGFLQLVNKQNIANYVSVAPAAYLPNWTMPGCEESWFKPDAVDAEGNSCLLAAAQQSLSCLGTESGIVSFKQLLQKNAGKKLFRDGTQVNVVFVSDTHDPGLPDYNNPGTKQLIDAQPSYSEFFDLINKSNHIADLKFHAIAPNAITSGCTEGGPWTLTKSYYSLADATGGVKVDPCTTTDFSKVAEHIVDSGSSQTTASPVLSINAKEILYVKVNGKKTSNYKLEEGGRRVTIQGLDLLKGVKVEISYRY